MSNLHAFRGRVRFVLIVVQQRLSLPPDKHELLVCRSPWHTDFQRKLGQ